MTSQRRAKIYLLLAIATLIAAVAAAPAYGAYGDDYGALPINDGAGPNEDVPALPGATHAFWAGTCDLASAPAPGAPILGGIGFRPTSILVPTGLPAQQPRWNAAPGPGPGTVEEPPGSGQWWEDVNPADGAPDSTPDTPPGTVSQTLAPAPERPDHCIDWGAQTNYTQPHPSQHRVWQTLPWGGTPGSGAPGQSGPAGDYTPSWRLPAATQAGSHPDGTTMFAWNRNSEGVGAQVGEVDGSTDNIVVDLPPGFVGNPQAVPECANADFNASPMLCPPAAQVGVLRLNIQAVPFGGANLAAGYDTTYPVYNLEPRPGRVAELGFAYASGENATAVRLVGKARTNGDYGVTAFAGQIPSALPPIAQSITLWGLPWAAENDMWRAKLGHKEDQSQTPPCSKEAAATGANHYIPPGGLRPECQASYDPSWADTASDRALRPFLTNETDCNPAPTVTLRTDSYQRPGALTAEDDPDPSDPDWKTYTSTSPAVTGCDQLDFEPDIDFSPTTSAADGATGLQVELDIPQKNDPMDGAGDPLTAPEPGAGQAAIDQYVQDATAYWRSPDGWATAHLKDTVVTLPPGVSVNPSGATGLAGCADSVVGVREYGNPLRFNNVDPTDGEGVECPSGSKIGTVVVETPLLAEQLAGDVILGVPETTNPQGENGKKMLRMFLVVRSKERGLVAKIYGSAVANPDTGQLTATFENNPELPFEHLSLTFKGGSKGLLAMPQRCGTPGWASTFTPWSGTAAQDDSGAFAVDANCAFGFAPTMAAGMDNQRPAASGSFSLRFARNDGEQWFKGLALRMPPGLAGSVKGVPRCSDAQASSGNCPATSRIGTVDATAGSGDPFVLEKKGDVYLTDGYKGAPFGLMAKVPVEAGPFRGDKALSPIVVRQALHVDRTDARVTVVSDPLPHIHHGIPLRGREITVVVDRPGLMRSPSDCSPKQIALDLTSVEGATASPSTPYQVSGCRSLAFKPKLSLSLIGRKQVTTGKHPGVRAVVTQRPGQSAIKRVKATLPMSLALDPANAQALCEFEDGTKPDIENHCPKGSIVGRARAVSPYLNDPLVGNVYFVKNVRRSRTGNLIRTLPMIIVALRGEIAVNLKGVSSTTNKGKLVNTFATVPDAPVSRFDMKINGGKNGILAVTQTRRGRINICSSRQVTDADIDGHNGRRADRSVQMKTPCAKRTAAKKRKGSR